MRHPLDHAAVNGHLDIIKLLEKKGFLVFDPRTDNGIWKASNYAQYKVVEYLLDISYYADPIEPLLLLSVRKNDPKLLSIFLEKGKVSQENYELLLKLGVQMDRPQVLQELLLYKKPTYKFQILLLKLTIFTQKPESLKVILTLPVKQTHLDNFYKLCVKLGYEDLAEILLEKGANPNIKTQ